MARILPEVDWAAFDSKTPREPRSWWVYFIQGDDGGPVKIGHTRRLRWRLEEVQAGYPFGRLRYVGVMPGVSGTEGDLHLRFRETRLLGEWFGLTDELVDFIASLPRAPASGPA